MRTFLLLLMAVGLKTNAQTALGKLTVEKIMRDPKWIGTSPANPVWSSDGKTLFFSWNPNNAPADSLYFVTANNKTPVKATVAQKQQLAAAGNLVYNKKRTAYTYVKDGDVFYTEIKP